MNKTILIIAAVAAAYWLYTKQTMPKSSDSGLMAGGNCPPGVYC